MPYLLVDRTFFTSYRRFNLHYRAVIKVLTCQVVLDTSQVYHVPVLLVGGEVKKLGDGLFSPMK